MFHLVKTKVSKCYMQLILIKKNLHTHFFIELYLKRIVFLFFFSLILSCDWLLLVTRETIILKLDRILLLAFVKVSVKLQSYMYYLYLKIEKGLSWTENKWRTQFERYFCLCSQRKGKTKYKTLLWFASLFLLSCQPWRRLGLWNPPFSKKKRENSEYWVSLSLSFSPLFFFISIGLDFCNPKINLIAIAGSISRIFEASMHTTVTKNSWTITVMFLLQNP